MKFNPCGRALDFGRRCYTVQVKPFKDSDLTVGWRWYPALPEAGTYDGWSFLASRDWLENRDEAYDLGEVVNDPREFYFGRPIPDATGEHVCGTADQFENGQEYDPDQNTLYRRDGLPVCCLPWVNEGIRAGDRPQAAVSLRPAYAGQVRAGDYPQAEVSFPPPLWVGRVRAGDYPDARPQAVEVVGNVRAGDYPNGANAILGGGVEDPGEDYCALQGQLALNQWYLAFASTPKVYAWGWLLDPGTYCISVRASDTSATGDVTVFRGPNCGDRTAIRVAGAAPGFPPWDGTGQIVDPPVQFWPLWWMKTITIEEEQFLWIVVQPDDAGGAYLAKVTLGGACALPPPLEEIRYYR